MYSKNDYRYYLEHQLLTSGGYLSHHGVMGMKWGIRRYQSYDTVPRKSGESGKETGLAKKRNRLENKKASNSAKIKKVQEDLKKPRAAVDMKMKVNDLNKQRKKELSVINNSQIADDKSYRKEVNKQINAYWDDRVREAKGKKTKSRNSGHGDYSKKYDRELIDLDLMTAEEYPRKNKNRR